MNGPQARVAALMDEVPDLPPRAAAQLLEMEEAHDARMQRDAFCALVERFAQAGAGTLIPLCGGLRYLSADGAVVVTLGAPVSAPPSDPPIHVEQVGDAAVVGFRDPQLVLPQLVQEVGDELYRLAAHPEKTRLVLNLQGVQFLSTALLGRLVGLTRMVNRAGGKVRLCSLDPLVLAELRLTHLDRVFETSEDEATALRQLEQPSN